MTLLWKALLTGCRLTFMDRYLDAMEPLSLAWQVNHATRTLLNHKEQP